MTAIPVPSVSRIDAEEDIVFDDNKLKKNLLPDFEKFENLPADWAFNVFLRLRPFTDQELKAGEDQQCLQISNDGRLLTANAPKESKKFKAMNRRGLSQSMKQFAFTKIFDKNTDQSRFYQETAQPVVKDFVSGKNGLVFTYGVTNSGKTYSLQGTPGNEGIIPQAVCAVFDDIGDRLISDVQFVPKIGGKLCYESGNEKLRRAEIKSQVLSMSEGTGVSGNQKSVLYDSLSDVSTQIESCNTSATTDNSQLSTTDTSESPVRYAIFVSFVELYCELLYDLLVPVAEDKLKSGRRGQVLTIIDDKKSVSHIKGMQEIQVNSASEVMKVLSAGQKNLHVAATRLNKDSSRSHCIFTITLVKVKDIPNPKTAEISKMYFCDLAGSERPSKTGEAGKRLKEAGNINNSLMKLGMCFETLRHNQKHRSDKARQKAFAYRDSKLTRLFRNCLLGEGRTCMIVNASMCASGFDETLHVLEFSGVARDVKRIEDTKRGTKRKTEITDDDFFAKVKSSRMTIGWDKTPPLEDNETTMLENDEDEESEYDSDSESDEEEIDFECDVGHWKRLVEKYLKVIDYLKDEYKKLKEGFDTKTEDLKKAREENKAIMQESSKRQDAIRNEAYHNQRQLMLELQGERQVDVEDTIALMTDEQNKKQDLMEQAAKNDLLRLKQRNEKRIAALKDEHEKDLEGVRAEAVSSAESQQTLLRLEIGNLKMENETKAKEIEALKRRSRRSSSCKDYDTKQLLLEIEEGKVLIESLIEEGDMLRQQIEDAQDRNNSLESRLAQSQDDANTRQMEMEEKELEIVELKKVVADLRGDIVGVEKKSEDIMKKNADLCGDIVVLDESKTFYYTEGILQYLVESSGRKALEIGALRDTVKEKDGAISALKLAEMRLVEDLKNSEEKVSLLSSEKVSLENELEAKVGDSVKMAEDLRILSEKLNAVQKIADEFHDLQEREKNASQANCELQDETDSLKSLLDEKTVELERLKKENEQAAEGVDGLKKRLDDKTNELERQKVENDRSADRIVDLKKQLDCKIDELEQQQKSENQQFADTTDLKMRLDSKIDELELRKNEIEQSADKIRGLEKELGSKIEELELRNKEIEQSADKMRCLKDRLERQSEAREHAVNERAAVEEKLQSLEAEFQAKKDVLREMRGDAKGKGEENEVLRRDLKMSEEKLKALQDRFDELTESKSAADAAIVSLRSELQSTRQNDDDRLKELREQNTNVTGELGELRSQLNKFREQSQILDCEFEDLENRLRNSEIAGQKSKDGLKKLTEQNKKSDCQLEDLNSQLKVLTEQNKDYDSELGDLKSKLRQKERDHASLKSNYDKLRAEVADVKKERDVKLENASSRLVDENRRLENDLEQCKKTVGLREKELGQFRDSRDRIVKALESQITAERQCHDKVKFELDEQATENAALKSEISSLQTKLRGIERDASSKCDENSQVINETDVDSGRSKRSRKQSTDDDVTTTSVRPSRGSKRGSSILKRGKRNVRPATPLPEAVSDDESPVEKLEMLESVKTLKILVSPVKDPKISESSSRNDENQGVLDDSELLKETGNRRCFPEPTMEIDATPDTSKRTRRRRRKTNKNSDFEDSDAKTSARKMTLRKTRAANYNNSNSNDVDAGSPALASNSKTLGSMIKNSPVGSALKGFKDAMVSSASKSPKKTRKASERRGKRLVKLQPEEISSPFEVMPDVAECEGADMVSDTPSRIGERLRRRK